MITLEILTRDVWSDNVTFSLKYFHLSCQVRGFEFKSLMKRANEIVLALYFNLSTLYHSISHELIDDSYILKKNI